VRGVLITFEGVEGSGKSTQMRRLERWLRREGYRPEVTREPDGTALGAVRAAFEAGRVAHVWVGETRPLLQGARLTAWELERAGIPASVIADSAAGSLMASGEVTHVVTGADRIARNGDTANKIGTYSLAVLAKHHNVPFYIAGILKSAYDLLLFRAFRRLKPPEE